MTTPQKKYSLPDMTYSFSVSLEGSETHHKWAGKFKYRRPSLGDRSRIDTMRARLAGDLTTLDPEVMEFIEAVSHLRFTLDEYPDWWAEFGYGLEMHDGNVVSEIYNRCLEYEAQYRDKVYSGEKSDVEEKSDNFGDVPESASAALEASATHGAGEARV